MHVALDISGSVTGWAFWRQGADNPESGLLKMPTAPKEVGKPAETLRGHLADLHTIEPIQTLFFEAQFIGGTVNRDVLVKLLGLSGVAEWFAFRIGAKCLVCEIAAWRKHFFLSPVRGDRAALKAAALAACHARGWSPERDDEADALGVLDYGLHCIGAAVPWRHRHMFGGRMEAFDGR